MCQAQHDEYMRTLEAIAKVAEGAVMDVSHGDQRKAAFAINKIINVVHARMRDQMLVGVNSEGEE